MKNAFFDTPYSASAVKVIELVPSVFVSVWGVCNSVLLQLNCLKYEQEILHW